MPPTTEYNWVLRTCGEESRVILDCSPRGSRTVCLAQSDLPASTTNDVGSANRGEKCAAPTGTLLVPQVSTPAWEDHRCALSEEIASQGAISAAWERLNPAHRNTAWFAAVEELKQERAVWSLAALLDHPSEDVGIVSARALTELGDRRAVGPLLAKARRLAVYKGESETTTIHAIFQHVVANALNRVTGAGVRLHDGQDPSGLLAGIEIWSAANR